MNKRILENKRILILSVLLMFVALSAGMLEAKSKVGAAVKLGLSGEGAINDSTIKAGKDFSIDIHIENDSIRTGFTLGFIFKSEDIKNIIHLTDSGNGINDSGDLVGHNGWENNSIWDFDGTGSVELDWDGKLPEHLGFWGLSIKRHFPPMELKKVISINLNIVDTGSLVVDSVYFPPGGKWMFSSPADIAAPVEPDWDGPYSFKVVK